MRDSYKEHQIERDKFAQRGKFRSTDMHDSRAMQAYQRRRGMRVSGQWIDEHLLPAIQTWGGYLLLIISWLGMTMFLNGEWTFTPDWWTVPAGGVAQFIITMWEWVTRHDKLSGWYLFPLLIDIASTIAGYSKVLYQPLYNVLKNAAASLAADIGLQHMIAMVISWALIGIVAFLLAFLPEAVLIDD